MTIIRKISYFYKKFFPTSLIYKLNNKEKIFNNKSIILILTLIITSIIFFSYSNYITDKNMKNRSNIERIGNSEGFSILTDFLLKKIKSPYEEIKYIIKRNDSIDKILKKYGIKKEEINNITKKLRQKKLSNIYSGRELKLILKKEENSTNSLVNLVFPISNTNSVEVRKYQNEFIVKENILQLRKKEIVVRNEINNNLYTAALEVGVEPNIIIEFARVFGFEVDFQRDIRKGNWFEILYEKFIDDNNKVRDTGKIIYASMFVNGEEINLYNFNYNNEEEYYDIKGKSITKSLMKTPINGARLSSSFGMRKHPILGYNKMHRGTDFAAPSGTPIMASGSGTITRARWCGGGGNCVKIKHNSTYETIYAHMKNFAKGIKEGKKVKQGQIIGYVGSTGMSTGPHLHYEVLVNGKKVNSQKLKLPSGKILKGNARKDFEIERIKIDLKLNELR